jgi:hypothetical protein
MVIEVKKTEKDFSGEVDSPISDKVIDDYLDELILGSGSGDDGIRTTTVDGEITDIGDTSFLDEEIEDQDGAVGKLNWMQENAPEWFSDWLYEAERPDLGSVDLSSTFGSMAEDAVTELGSERGLDRLSDVGRSVIQSGAYVGDFWKDLAMAPYRLFQGEGFKDQYEHLIDNPQWAKDIGYESDWGQAVMDNPAVRGFQEHILPFSGAGIIGMASRIPAAGKILQMMYPTTSAMAKIGKVTGDWKSQIAQNIGNFGRALYGKPWGPMLPKPGSLGFNVGLPWLIGQGKEKSKGKPSVFDMSGAVDFSPISSAYAADVPMDRGHAAGQMPTPVRRTVQRHPREMMEQGYNVRRGPELTTQSDYERLQQENIAANKPRYLAHGA